MSKTEVYSWRVDPALKRELEAAARARKSTVAALLHVAVTAYLEHEAGGAAGDDQSARRARMLKLAGTITGDGTSATNAVVRDVVAASAGGRKNVRRSR